MTLENRIFNKKRSEVVSPQIGGVILSNAEYAKILQGLTGKKIWFRTADKTRELQLFRENGRRGPYPMGTTVLLIPRGTSEAELSSFFAAKGFHPSASKNYKAKNVPKTRRIMAARMREFVEINLRNNEVIASKEQVVATKAFTKAADLLSLSDEEACQIIGVKESEILKMKEKSQCLETKSKPFELAILVIRLFKQVDAMFGGDIKVMVQWLRSFNTAIGDVPAVKIASITGLYDVVAYLEGRHGAI